MGGARISLLAQVLGPDVAFTHTQFITKMPEPGARADGADADNFIPLHQDDGYGQLEPPKDVTVWTALTDTNERNGCLVVVPGSHAGDWSSTLRAPRTRRCARPAPAPSPERRAASGR